MKRTFLRPLPSGRVTPQYALGWGVASAGASAAILGLGANELTMLLGMGNLALYALPYTLSKTRSEVNTWVGAVVGAVPPMMGWAAATNCSLEALLTYGYACASVCVIPPCQCAMMCDPTNLNLPPPNHKLQKTAPRSRSSWPRRSSCGSSRTSSRCRGCTARTTPGAASGWCPARTPTGCAPPT